MEQSIKKQWTKSIERQKAEETVVEKAKNDGHLDFFRRSDPTPVYTEDEMKIYKKTPPKEIKIFRVGEKGANDPLIVEKNIKALARQTDRDVNSVYSIGETVYVVLKDK